MTYQPHQPHQSIKDWLEDDRPREKLAKLGPACLSDAELLAVLIRVGRRGRSALDLARELIEPYRLDNRLDIQRLGTLGLTDFIKVKGIGFHTAVTLMAALELGRRRESIVLPKDKTRIRDAKSVVAFLRPRLKDEAQEQFVVVYLNQANTIIDTKWLSKGGIASTVIDTRVVLRTALEQRATGFILCHNHPGGSLKPSQADIAATHRVRNAAALLELRLIDHLIVSNQGYYSLADEGLLG